MSKAKSHKLRWVFAGLLLAAALLASPLHAHYRAAKVLRALSDGAEPAVTSTLFDEPGLRYRVYGAPTSGRAIVLVHGVHQAGIEEPRLVHFARALADQGFVVMTPELTELTHYHTPVAAADTIKRATLRLSELSAGAQVTLLGISFGGGLALIAAADKQVAPHIRTVITLGAPADYARVGRFFATNEELWPDGKREPLTAHGYGLLVFALQNTQDIFPGADAPHAELALAAHLQHNAAAEAEHTQLLSAGGRATLAQFLAADNAAASTAVLAVVAGHEAALTAASPEHFAPDIQVPVFILHASTDNVIPPAESAWLSKSLPHTRATLVSTALGHASVDAHLSMRELWPIVHFLADALSE